MLDKNETIKEEDISLNSNEDKSSKDRDYFHTVQIFKPKKNVFVPGKVTEYLFCILLVLALIMSLINIPLGSLMSTNSENIEFKIGYPMTFFQVNTENPEKLPLKFLGLLVDFLVYFIIAYIVEILLGLFVNLFDKKRKKIPQSKLELIRKAKKAHDYYLSQGMTEENVNNLFKDKGWTEEDIILYLK
ncbi:hypothetical protein KA107_01540 [Candidatus Pacearchaeota archaeon]|nr:hypothetical protein [Candidatus Pacearchaeota archaeon]